MIRESLDANAAHAMVVSTGHELVSMMWRQSTGDHTRNVNAEPGTKRVWLRLVKEGIRFTSYMKLENQVNWEKVYERDVTFKEGPFYVGIAACSHIQGSLASLTVRNFEILDKIWVPVPPPHLGELNVSPFVTDLFIICPHHFFNQRHRQASIGRRCHGNCTW